MNLNKKLNLKEENLEKIEKKRESKTRQFNKKK